MKEMICTGAGLVGSFIAGLFGGWDAGLTTLVICMAIDYATGLLCAGVFHKSQKSANGALESKACFKGLVRKCVILLLVLVAHRLDLALGGSDGGGETAGAGADDQDVLGGLRLADLIIWVGFVADHGIQFTGAAATSVDMSHTAVETTHASADVQEAAFLGFVGGFRVSKGLPCHTDQIRLAGDQDGVGHTGVVDAADHDDGQAGDRHC